MKYPFAYSASGPNGVIVSGEARKMTDVPGVMWKVIKALTSGQSATITVTML